MNRAETASERQFYTRYARELHEKSAAGLLAELLPYPHFVVWRHEEIAGQRKKPPYNPTRIGGRAYVNNQHTWGTFEQALTALESGLFNGIGFVTSRDDPFVGIDLDHCVNTNRFIHKWAQGIVDELATYTEYSPTDGLHLLAQGKLPGSGRKIGNLELNDRDHFLTLTLNHVPDTPRTIEPAWVEVSYLYLQQTGRERPAWRSSLSTGGALLDPAKETTGGAVQRLADERVIREALADQKSNFSRYWSGDETLWTGRNSPRKSRSEAEHTLALMLLTRTGDNEEDTKRLYRQSGLYDKERCRRISGHDPLTSKPLTYLDVTVRNALRYRQALHKRQHLT